VSELLPQIPTAMPKRSGAERLRSALILAFLFAAPAFAQDVTVATFNCEWLVLGEVHRKPWVGVDEDDWDDDAFRAARFREAAGHVAAVLARTDADVLALTEVGDSTDVAVLAEALDSLGVPYPHRFVGHSDDRMTGQHVAVLSRLPLSDLRDRIPGRAVYLGEPDDPETEDDTGLSKALRVTVDAHGRPLLLYVAHLVSERGGYEADAQRLAQAEVLRRHMLPALGADSLVVVAGDFNDGRGQPTLRRLRGLDDPHPDLLQTGLAGYFDDDEVDERWTYVFEGERQQIDHVLVSFAVHDAVLRSGIDTRTLDHGDPLASDHRPLVVRLRFRE
jgi:endonuclease/exonuclease/phosphatase family metal-dependent hydrolase